jgi:ketosteroid isomerase-like protein
MHYAVTSDAPQANGEALVALYEAFAQGDVETVRATLTDEIEWRVNGSSPVAEMYRGIEAVLSFFGRMMALYDGTLHVEVVSVLADDRSGVVRVAERAERPGEGLSYSRVHVWELRDGRCCAFESFYDDTYSRFGGRGPAPTRSPRSKRCRGGCVRARGSPSPTAQARSLGVNAVIATVRFTAAASQLVDGHSGSEPDQYPDLRRCGSAPSGVAARVSGEPSGRDRPSRPAGRGTASIAADYLVSVWHLSLVRRRAHGGGGRVERAVVSCPGCGMRY